MAVTIWNHIGWQSRTPNKIVLENGEELSAVGEFILIKDASNTVIGVFSGANVYGAKLEK